MNTVLELVMSYVIILRACVYLSCGTVWRHGFSRRTTLRHATDRHFCVFCRTFTASPYHIYTHTHSTFLISALRHSTPSL